MLVRSIMALAAAATVVTAASAGGYRPVRPAEGEMEYFGGTVFSSAEVVSVIWGPGVRKQTLTGMPGFFKVLVDSTYMDQLSIYGTKHQRGVNGHKGSNQTIGRGSFFGQVEIMPKDRRTTLTNQDIHKELKYQIAEGTLPPQSPNTIYMIFFPPKIVIDAFGLQSCTDFAAYHYATSTRETPSNIFYGVIPDCGYTFEDHTIVSSAQFADAVTDNLEARNANPVFPQAWESSTGFEIGDLCDGIPATLSTKKTTYYVQEVYLNTIAGCGTGNFTSR